MDFPPQEDVKPQRPQGPAQWEEQKDVILELYSKTSLAEVAKRMKRDRGFWAT